MNNKEIKKKRLKKGLIRTLVIIGNSLFALIVGSFLIFFLVNFVDQNTNYNFTFFGLRTSVIVSNSMQYKHPDNTYLTDDMKQINKNDVIITSSYQSYESIQQYDVLTYYADNKLICHRVVNLYEENGKQYIVTRGDSNNVDDTPFEYSLVKGKVSLVIPGAGTFIQFVQSPYLAIAVFGSLFFVFAGMFVFSLGDTREYDKLIQNKPMYEEDKFIVINSNEYDEDKKKKNYLLVGADNHYEIINKKGSLKLIRYIRTDYNNKIDNRVVSGLYDKPEFKETILLSILSYGFEAMTCGYNPLKDIKSFLIDKKIISKKSNQLMDMAKIVIESTPSDMSIDITSISEEDQREYKYLLLSYQKTSRYLKKKDCEIKKWCDIIYSYLFYCTKTSIDPMDAFKEKGLSFDA